MKLFKKDFKVQSLKETFDGENYINNYMNSIDKIIADNNKEEFKENLKKCDIEKMLNVRQKLAEV